MHFSAEQISVSDTGAAKQQPGNLPDNSGLIILTFDSAVSDYAPLINAALRQPGVVEVRLAAGTFAVSSAIELPSGAHLTGAGAGLTLVQASPDFMTGSIAAVVQSEYRAIDITLADFSVDASKLSPDGLRLNGVFMDEVVGFDIARVDVYNVTGYAQFARGDVNSLVAGVPGAVGTTGTYADCNTYNAQVHFEVMFGDGVSYTNCTAADGDGDISAEAYFHPLLGSRNISYNGVSAYGDALIGFSLISAYRSLENISIINSQVEIDRPASGYGLLDFSGLPTLNLQIENSSFISREYIGFAATGITGSATGSTFQGGVIGLNIENLSDGTPPDFDVIDSHAIALLDPNILAGIVGVYAVAGVSFTGGTIEARGSGGLMLTAGGGVVVSPQTVLINDGFDTRVAFADSGGAALLFPLVGLPTAPFGSFAGGEITITLRNPVAPTDAIEIISGTAGGGVTLSGTQISFGGTVIGTLQAGPNAATTTIALSPTVDTAAVTALLRSLAYSSGGEAIGPDARLIEVLISDGAGLSRDLNAAVHGGAVQGGLTNDLYIVHNPAATIQESAGFGIDEVRTALSNYTLSENLDNLTALGAGTATLRGNARANVITGNSGSNVLIGAGGADQLAGGLGDDVYYADGSDTVVELAAGGYDAVYADEDLTLGANAEIELLGTLNYQLTTALTLRGNAFGNTIVGNYGANWLYGEGGNDHLQGLAGNDILDGGAGTDILNGGDGADTYYADGSDTILEVVGGGQDRVFVSASFTLAAGVNIEALSTADATSVGAINLTGNEYKNFITGNAGANTLSGGGAKDKLNGLGGDDVLIGGAGADRLTGGTGADRFRFETAADSAPLTADWITDFETGDRIDLTAIDANPSLADDQQFAFIGGTAFSLVAGQLRAVETAPGKWTVEGDLDGDGQADFAITVDLAGPVGLTAADFML